MLRQSAFQGRGNHQQVGRSRAPHALCRNMTTAAFLKYLVCGLTGSRALAINPVEAPLNCRRFFLFSSLGLDFPGDSSAQASTW